MPATASMRPYAAFQRVGFWPTKPLHASDAYLREKLDAAVDSLATSAEPIQHRLQAAWNGALGRLTPEDFADASERERFERIHAVCDQLNAPGDVGQVPVSTAAMADARAEHVACEIVKLRDAVVGRMLRARA
jgi:hypothetical protein